MRDFLRGDNFIKGLMVSIPCTLLLVPNIIYKYFITHAEFVRQNLSPDMVVTRLFADVFFILVALQISATAGFAWSKKPYLAGMGKQGNLFRKIMVMAGFGIVIAIVEAVVFDFAILRPVFENVRVNPFAFAPLFAEDVIFRFGMMAIVFRLTGSPFTAILVQAVVNVLLASIPEVPDIGRIPNCLIAISAGKKFILAFLYGWICAHKGLLPVMAMRLIIGLRFTIYALTGIE